jgi:hypothetical protein
MSEQEFYVFHNISSVDLYPIQFGKEKCDPWHHYGPTLTHNYLFHYILSGRGSFLENERHEAIQLGPGQGFLMPPNTVCSYTADQDDPWTYCWIEFNGLKAANFMRQAGLNANNLIFTPHKPMIISSIKDTLETIIRNHSQHESFLIAQLYLLVDYLIRFSKHSPQQRPNEIHSFYIREAIHYIQDHYMDNPSVDQLADICHLNRNYFTRLFKQELHMTPSQFILTYRINQSCELLASTNRSIRDIAEQIGYSNQFNFSSAFKRVKGMTPMEWRRRYR